LPFGEGEVDIVKALLANGADIHVKDLVSECIMIDMIN